MDSGKTRALAELCEEVKNGETDKEKLFRTYGPTYVRLYKGISHTIDLVSKPKAYKRTEKPINIIWFGKTGCGKTWDAEETAIQQDASMYKIPIHQLRKGWYDGYAGETIILFDDFRGQSMEPHEFLNLLDGLDRLPVKGNYITNKSKQLFFTSPDHPINWWPKWYAKDDNNWAQVKRRLNIIYECVDWVVTKTEIQNSNLYKIEMDTTYVK